jgi:prepilin-type N-terminal cleavage/methylation domain-containing protein
MRAAKGLSLVELLMALAILAVLAGIGTPYLLSSLPALRVNAAVRQLLGDLRLARALSVERGLDVLVCFPAAEPNRYRLAFDSYPAPPANDHRLTAEDEPIKTIDVPALCRGIGLSTSDPDGPPDGVSFPGDVALFTPDGRASTGAVYLQPLSDYGVRHDRDRKVTVLGATGRAKAYAWRGNRWE